MVRLDNPLNRQMDTLRTTLVPGLLDSLALNINRGGDNVRLFEVGRVFRESPAGDGAPPALPRESVRVAAVALGRAGDPHWSGAAPELDFFALKGVLEELCRRLAGGLPSLRRDGPEGPAPRFLDPAAAAVVHWLERPAGWLGRLAPAAVAAWSLPAGILAFELELPPDPAPPRTAYSPLPRHPAAERDLALILPEDATYERLEETVRRAGGPLLESVRPFDRYAGPPVPSGHVSLAVRLVFRGQDRTLTTAEVEQAQSPIVEHLRAELGAQVRDTKEES
jgi:phenylalanyl-tRNA synthetase beta chain